MAAVVCGFERSAAIQEADIHATIDFLQTLGLDARETRIRRQREPVHAAQLRRVQQRELLPEQRLIPRLTVGRAQLHLATRADQALEPVGSGEAREDEVLIDVAVYTAALGSDTRRENDSVAGEKRLLVQVQR